MTKRKRSSQQESSILCVTNFPDYLQPKDLESYFKEIGSIKKITMFYDKESRVKAYVQFETDLTTDALKFNRASIENERIRLRFAIPQDRDVVFSNVAKSVTEDQLKTEYLNEIGQVQEVQQLSETAYKVRFATVDEAREAIDYDGADIEGQVISVIQLRLSAKDLQKIMLAEESVEEANEGEAADEAPKKRQKKEDVAAAGKKRGKKSDKKGKKQSQK
uniref:RRM domain-containing protein n=1 Tax=Percolomonas cosmopolitus TaxID=63605 RepID=A0A7S1KMU0_9EUKA|eukprot:CAMPEP_0117444964 /NCGR_PEP_ID=MMETSP0759-20121206/5535_1 /TAXON_ID=63605 /ORGANISM="Percolomonas cosmopolitus, Strain WS" /LENGTH=218 /DNA_ID=CAMNT_0005237093 /DNA_START=86 /DNA_END=742 /DNA_ORIENTATION=-